jgi:DNA-binding NtrC family response regulator
MPKQAARARVLVVDDEPLIRWALGETLRDLGCEVVEAGDGRSAIAAVAESAPFEIVLLDVRLPDCEDLTLLTRIRALAPQARIILMTAHGTNEMADRALDLGAFSFVSKPFELAEVAAMISGARDFPSA